MVFDHDPDICEFVAELLRDEVGEVETCESIADLHSSVLANPPGAVLSDHWYGD